MTFLSEKITYDFLEKLLKTQFRDQHHSFHQVSQEKFELDQIGNPDIFAFFFSFLW